MAWGWWGCDLDGTIAFYDGWRGPGHIGAPIPLMVARVKDLLAAGEEVRIFTARVSSDGSPERDREVAISREAIRVWTLEHIGQELVATCQKDFGMKRLFDDRAIQVEENTGILIQ